MRNFVPKSHFVKRYQTAIPPLIVVLGFFGFTLQSCKTQSDNTAELEAEIERLENVVATQRIQLDDYGGVSFESLEGGDPITSRHLMTAVWYSNQELGNYYIGRTMDHEWGPRWNRRSPLSILEEQTNVMRKFLEETRALEELSPWPPTWPSEKDISPNDGARIDWENFIEKDGGKGQSSRLVR